MSNARTFNYEYVLERQDNNNLVVIIFLPYFLRLSKVLLNYTISICKNFFQFSFQDLYFYTLCFILLKIYRYLMTLSYLRESIFLSFIKMSALLVFIIFSMNDNDPNMTILIITILLFVVLELVQLLSICIIHSSKFYFIVLPLISL